MGKAKSSYRGVIKTGLLIAVLALAALSFGPRWAIAADDITERVSVDSLGNEGDATSDQSAISDDGRYVAFSSDAENLVPEDTSGRRDIFIHDRLTGSTERVSIASDGTQANGGSFFPSISGDGRFVAYYSHATNLVPGDTNGEDDVFLRDRVDGTTERVSVASDGSQGDRGPNFFGVGSRFPSISPDGRFITFISNAPNLVIGDTINDPFEGTDVFVRDRMLGTTERVSISTSGSEGNGFSGLGAISDDGRFIAFASQASNLISGDTNGRGDIFLHDRVTDITIRVSVASEGTQANAGSALQSISGDGRFIAFQSSASNLVPGDTNGETDVFVHDRLEGTTERVSVATDGAQGNGFSGGTSGLSTMSNDGRFVVFRSDDAPELGHGVIRTDVLVRDRLTGTTNTVSVAIDGNRGNGASLEPSISGDGNFVSFSSQASDLVPEDANARTDVFVREITAKPVGGMTTFLPSGSDSLIVVSNTKAYDFALLAIFAVLILYAARHPKGPVVPEIEGYP